MADIRRYVHRAFYPTAKPDQPDVSNPIVKASSTITPKGVNLKFLDPHRDFTPDELHMLGRWLHSLAKEAEGVAVNGKIDECRGWDVVADKAVSIET